MAKHGLAEQCHRSLGVRAAWLRCETDAARRKMLKVFSCRKQMTAMLPES